MELQVEIATTKNEILSKVTDYQKHSEDFVVKSKEIKMEEGKIVYGGKSYSLTETARSQLANWVGMEDRYYHKLVGRKDGLPLLDTNVNYWLERAERAYTLRTYDDGRPIIRAVMSDRYKVIPNSMIVGKILGHFEEMGDSYHLLKGYISPDKLNLIYLSDKSLFYVGEDKTDEHKLGVSVSNSEVGMGAFSLGTYVYRLVCSNGAIASIGGDTDRWIHMGGRKAEKIYAQDGTYRTEIGVIETIIDERLKKTVNFDNADKLITNLRRLKSVVVEDGRKKLFLDSLTSYFNLGEAEKEMIEVELKKKGETYYDYLQAITAVSKKLDGTKSLQIEKVGGILTSDTGYVWGMIEEKTNIAKLVDDKKKKK